MPFAILGTTRIWITTLIVTIASGCASAPKQKTISAREQVTRDVEASLTLQTQLGTKLVMRSDPTVNRYLDALATRLSQNHPALSLMKMNVQTIESNGSWSSYAVPGAKIYLSVGLLKSLTFENEVAALLAFELGNLAERHLVSRSSAESSNSDIHALDFSRFRFSTAQHILSARAAVKFLYEAKIDPRGLMAIWREFKKHPSKSPFSIAQLEELQDATIAAIGGNVPLRNPVIRSDGFNEVQKRISKL